MVQRHLDWARARLAWDPLHEAAAAVVTEGRSTAVADGRTTQFLFNADPEFVARSIEILHRRARLLVWSADAWRALLDALPYEDDPDLRAVRRSAARHLVVSTNHGADALRRMTHAAQGSMGGAATPEARMAFACDAERSRLPLSYLCAVDGSPGTAKVCRAPRRGDLTPASTVPAQCGFGVDTPIDDLAYGPADLVEAPSY